MVTFYYKEKRTYRQLLNDERKAWIIDMEGETAPQQVSSEAMRNYEVNQSAAVPPGFEGLYRKGVRLHPKQI